MFSVSHLNKLREAELSAVLPLFPKSGRVLEIGAGTGRQAAIIAAHGYEVEAIDLANSDYSNARLFPVRDYNGKTLPYTNASFDVVFTSNTLEHIRDLGAIHSEIKRVLKPSGVCIHVLPTHAWRFWTMVASVPALFQYVIAAIKTRTRRSLYELVRQGGIVLVQPRHGERGFGLAELWLFHPSVWRKNFRHHGFVLLKDAPIGLFYTGEMLFGEALGLESRKTFSRFLGSACHVYKLEQP